VFKGLLVDDLKLTVVLMLRPVYSQNRSVLLAQDFGVQHLGRSRN